MVKSISTYTGGLHCELKHESSGATIQTDAPKDNMGKGESFSPTDLVGAALASCILTTMAMMAEKHGVSLQGAQIEVDKIMTPPPRKIGEFVLKISLPSSVPTEYRERLEHVIEACPVHRSLHPDLKVTHTLEYSV